MLFYSIVIFLSAFLLFQIQPLISKYILPWFGGTPAVWSISLLFFQILLLVGYAYSFWLANRLRERYQGIIHMGILSISLLLIILAILKWPTPIMPGLDWRPTNEVSPIWNIFTILGASVGLPYFLLSTNSPLLQVWFNIEYPHRSPYRLYALSNIGSLLALITYPILIEPLLTLRMQGWIWTICYAVFAVLVGYLALHRIKVSQLVEKMSDQTKAFYSQPKPKIWQPLLWVALTATSSTMLLAITSQITQEVAVIPFLWILPLTIYLLSFILTFLSDRWYSRGFYGMTLIATSVTLFWVLAQGVFLNITIQIAEYLVLLFVCCMICHGELVRLKPHTRYLTLFYLMVSLGGAIGGIFVNFVAPHIFKGYWEFHLGLVTCWVLLFIMFQINPPVWSRRKQIFMSGFLLAGTIIVGDLLFVYIQTQNTNSLSSSRNFYGVLRVRSIEPDLNASAYQLTNGVTAHGFQYIDAARRHLTTAYYTEKSGVGRAILNNPKRYKGMRIGVLGLGIGTIAAYGQQGDTIRFYEINPEVIKLAEGKGGFFSFLHDCPSYVETVWGDARISLEHELEAGQPQRFDLLALDTFSSDSIPTHLLTKESFAIYLRHIQPDGLLALHVTNHHLALLPVVRQLADASGLSGVVVENAGDNHRHYRSTWVLLSKNVSFLQKPEIAGCSYQLSSVPKIVGLWTDDYSNLFEILK
jgi:hypothetical protein